MHSKQKLPSWQSYTRSIVNHHS